MLAVTREPGPRSLDDRDAWDAIIREHGHRVIVALLIPMSLCCCVPVGSFAVWQYVNTARHHGSSTAAP